MGYAVGASKRAVPVGDWAYGIPRNLYRLDETSRPVMGPARVMIVVSDDLGDGVCGRAFETTKVPQRRTNTWTNNRCMVARKEMGRLTMLEKGKKRWKGRRELKEVNKCAPALTKQGKQRLGNESVKLDKGVHRLGR